MTNDDDLQRVIFTHEAIAAVQAINVAEQLGVFRMLGKSPADSATLARQCAISERGAVALLSALAGMGLLEATEQGAYRLCFRPMLAEVQSLWKHLEAVIRTGQPCFDGAAPADAGAHYPRIVPELKALFGPAAERFAAHVARPKLKVIDLGCGSAPWSLALASRDPECHVTAVDLPSVLVETRRAIQAAGCEPQFTLLARDLVTASDWLTQDHDLAIVANLCHLFDEATNEALLARVFHALRPHGRVAIMEALPNEDGDGPLGVVLYGLGLLMRTRSGRLYPLSRYAGWLNATGFGALERIDLSVSPAISLIVARRGA